MPAMALGASGGETGVHQQHSVVADLHGDVAAVAHQHVDVALDVAPW